MDDRRGGRVQLVWNRADGHGRRRVKVRDLPIAGRDVVLVWAKRMWQAQAARAFCSAGTPP